MDVKDIPQLFDYLINRLRRFIPVTIAFNRATNFCLVASGIRPACLWYNDFEAKKSVKVLDSIETDQLGYALTKGTIETEDEKIEIPQILIFGMNNQKALDLTKEPWFYEDLFQDHQKLGEVLGYVCAGDSPESQYHVRLVGWVEGNPHYEFVIFEQMCQKAHKIQFRKFAQEVQDWMIQHSLPIEIHLFTIDRKSEE